MASKQLLQDAMDIAELINRGRRGNLEAGEMYNFGHFAAKYNIQLQKESGWGCGSYFTDYYLGLGTNRIYVGTIFDDWNDKIEFMCSSEPLEVEYIVTTLVSCIYNLFNLEEFERDLQMEINELA